MTTISNPISSSFFSSSPPPPDPSSSLPPPDSSSTSSTTSTFSSSSSSSSSSPSSSTIFDHSHLAAIVKQSTTDLLESKDNKIQGYVNDLTNPVSLLQIAHEVYSSQLTLPQNAQLQRAERKHIISEVLRLIVQEITGSDVSPETALLINGLSDYLEDKVVCIEECVLRECNSRCSWLANLIGTVRDALVCLFSFSSKK